MKRITEDGEIVDVNCEDCVTGIIPFFKTPYNHDTTAESNRTGLKCEDPSRTDQSFKEESDINTVMERIKQGAQPPVPLPEHFGDAFAIPTLLEARTRIAESNAAFYNLAPKIREEFLNDPSRWEDQVIKDVANGNLDNLERMGLDMTEVKQRMQKHDDDQLAAQASQDEAQLRELEERLAKRTTAAQGASPAQGGTGKAGGATTAPPPSKD